MSHSVEKTRDTCDNRLSKQPSSLSPGPQTSNGIEANQLSTAVQHHRNGELERAEQLYKQCIAQNRNSAEAHSNLGVICLSSNRLDEGIQHFKTALSIRPTYLSALKNLGNALFSQNNPGAAIEHYEQALSLSPNDIEILVSLANASQANKDYDRAISYHRQAIEQSTNNPELLYKLAQTLREQGNIDGSIREFCQALSLFPNNFKLTAGLASACLCQGQIETAITHYLEALHLNPSSASAWSGLGLAYHAIGRFRDGISAYYKALEIEPDNAQTHTYLAILLMLIGEFREGWQSYKYRFKYKPDLMRSPSQLEQWDGDFDCDEIILINEQGIGDTFLFVRYAQLLRQHFSKVTVCVPTKLIELLQYSLSDPGISIHHSFNYALGTTKARWVPMLSVPQYFGITRDTPILNTPYLSAPPERVEHWRQQLKKSPDKMLIGLNWQGNPAQKYVLMKGRSFHLEKFAWLSEIPGIELVSLQKGKGSEQLETCSFSHAFIANQAKVNEAWDYVDTAAIFMNCDLIITSDTSVAHLAGALGKPTWILLQSIPEWRWGLAGKSTAWYPSAQLFRQTEQGDWIGVMRDVRRALEQLVASSTQTQSPIAPPKNSPSISISIPVSIGELIDKMTILEIKVERLTRQTQRDNAATELHKLQSVLDKSHLAIETSLVEQLKQVNLELWDIEDRIRILEQSQNFGESFIQLARSVYKSNDRRAQIKRIINERYCSELIEEKSYAESATQG